MAFKRVEMKKSEGDRWIQRRLGLYRAEKGKATGSKSEVFGWRKTTGARAEKLDVDLSGTT